VDIDQSN
jgi:calcium-dependent protein kinase